MNHNLFTSTSLAVKTENSWVVKMHVLVKKGCLDPLCEVYYPTSCWGAARNGEQGHGPRLADLFFLVFRYAFAFHSHPTHTSSQAHLPTVVPSPLPVVAFQCKWLDEWLQLAHQKASLAEGPWWLRFSQATPPLPSPIQHFVPTPLHPFQLSWLPKWSGWQGTSGL